MSDLSEDENSDSSREFLIDPDKIDLDSTFFTAKTSKLKPALTKTYTGDDTSDDESTDDDFHDVNIDNNIEIFSQVLKNLESSQKLNDENVKHEQSVSESTIHDDKKNEQFRSKKGTSSNEINELLLQGESSGTSFYNETENAPEEDDDVPTTSEEYTIPKDGVKIVLPGTSIMINRKKRGGPDLKAILRRRLRDTQILIEKVGLLCWLTYGFHLNRQINEPEVMASSLSLIPTAIYPKNRIDLTYLEKFTKWFRNIFTLATNDNNDTVNKEALLIALKDKKVLNYKVLVLIYVSALRALGINCRLVVSLCPPHKVLNDSPLLQSNVKKEGKTKEKGNSSKNKNSKDKNTVATAKGVPENSPEAKKKANEDAKKKAAEVLRSKSKNSNSNKNKSTKTSRDKQDNKDDVKKENIDMKQEKPVSNLRQLRSRKVVSPSEDKSKIKGNTTSKIDGTTSKYYKEESTDSEVEFQPKPKRLAVPKPNNSNQKTDVKQANKNRKLLSSDSENEEVKKTGKTQDIWPEVYLDSEENWICVSVMDEKVHCVSEVYKKAQHPVLYVIAWNSEGLIKDVTRRYCPRWLTVTRKQRVDEKWWQESLCPWKEKNTAISRAEDEMLLQKELEQPLPKTIGECKGHPLYALARHLLKYEALYPPDCVPLGRTSTGEAIYSRHCVHTLCSRETWLKKARVVKPKQDAYKIVKAMPKYDKLSGMKIKGTALELFGEWQTMDYVPPEAKDGIVPRNEYGNVDLFKQCMLPKGTVHINLPALNRVARKLNIDCAPAVVGFNFGCMGAVPAFEGFVVCSEYEDTLREAWEAEQIEAAKRAKEKREKRVYGNWKRLIHGLIIRERLAAKYEFGDTEKSPNKRTKQKKTTAKKAKVL